MTKQVIYINLEKIKIKIKKKMILITKKKYFQWMKNEKWEKSKSFLEISWRNDRIFDWYGFTKNIWFGKLSTSLIDTLICWFELKLLRIE
jgi:hypothetical protein